MTVDEGANKAEARDDAEATAGDLEATARAAAELEPFYREMYPKTAARDVGMNRWAHAFKGGEL